MHVRGVAKENARVILQIATPRFEGKNHPES